MSSTPAGWYPDPEDAAQQRYWDGARWTEHVASSAAAPEAGWHPDPSTRGQLRYWDGLAWTEQVREVPLFDGMVPLVTLNRKKEQHLLVTTEEVVWGDERIRWSDVTWFSQLVTVQNGVETIYEIWLDRGDVQSKLGFARAWKNRLARVAYDTIIDQLRATLGVRVVEGLLGMVADAEPVRTAGLVFSPEGFGLEGKGALVPWTEYAGIEVLGHEGIFVQLFRQQGDKRKKAMRVKVDQLRAWAIPPVVEAHARLYGSGP